MATSDQEKLIVHGDPLATLKNCRGYYSCPKSLSGERLGPLVAYARTYGPEKKHRVGDVYLNGARAERNPRVLRHFAQQIAPDIRETFGRVDWIMGVPEGGKAFALLLAEELGCQYIYPDKSKSAEEGQPSETSMKFDRHEIEPGTKGIVCEDVCHNFTRTIEVLDLVEAGNAKTIGIACLFNRSSDSFFTYRGGVIAVVSLKEIPTSQYEQEDPAVSSDVGNGNLVLNPKQEWPKLLAAMTVHQSDGAFATGAGP